MQMRHTHILYFSLLGWMCFTCCAAGGYLSLCTLRSRFQRTWLNYRFWQTVTAGVSKREESTVICTSRPRPPQELVPSHPFDSRSSLAFTVSSRYSILETSQYEETLTLALGVYNPQIREDALVLQ